MLDSLILVASLVVPSHSLARAGSVQAPALAPLVVVSARTVATPEKASTCFVNGADASCWSVR